MRPFWIIPLALAFATAAQAQRDPLADQLRTSPTARYGAKWTAQAWVRPDPLAAKFAAFEREGLTDQEVLRQIQSLQSRATLSTEEAFRFGYLAARARFIPTATVAYPTSAMRAAEAMAKLPQPPSAQFARIRFLLEFTSWQDPRLVPMARRLVKEFPKLPGLRMHLAWGLLIDPRQDKLEEAVSIAQSLNAKFPKDVDFLALLADAYGMVGLSRSDRTLKKKAIHAYEELLRMPGVRQTARGLAEVRLKALREAG